MKYTVCIYTTNRYGDLVVYRTFDYDDLEVAHAAAEQMRNEYGMEYPLINVQYPDGRVYADFEI